jgi:hypothetical protein
MPLGTPGFDVVMLEYWAFNDISKVAASELLRFDGLATLLYATQGDYALQNDHYRTFVENQLKRPLPPLLHPGSTLPLYFPRNPLGDVHCAELFLSGLQDPFNFGDFFLHCFSHELSERVLAGWMPVVGTGMTPEGNFKMSTFNSSLGIELSSRQNMRSIYIESIFSELDFALQMIRERTSTSSVPENVIPENQNFVEQLQQLTALRTSGALTEEEFSAAKARLLGRQQD